VVKIYQQQHPLSKTTQFSQYQKGKTNLDLLKQKGHWVAVASSSYANLNLTPDNFTNKNNKVVFTA